MANKLTTITAAAILDRFALSRSDRDILRSPEYVVGNIPGARKFRLRPSRLLLQANLPTGLMFLRHTKDEMFVL